MIMMLGFCSELTTPQIPPIDRVLQQTVIINYNFYEGSYNFCSFLLLLLVTLGRLLTGTVGLLRSCCHAAASEGRSVLCRVITSARRQARRAA